MSYQAPYSIRSAAAKIVAIYVVFGLAWIYGSDTVLGWLVHDHEIMVKIAVVKGSLFIICTASILYFLISRFIRQLAAAESMRRESLESYQVIFNATNEAIFVHDAESGCIVDVNDRMLEIYGYTYNEALMADIGQLSEGNPPYSQAEAFENVQKAMTEGPQVFEWRCRKKTGELFWTEVSLKRVTTNEYDRVIAVVRDITERKNLDDVLRIYEVERLALERQLLHAQKLESLGVLAGGIAHDFNNILTSIVGNADLALMKMTPESPSIDNLLRIESAAANAADLARQMLAYSGKGKFVVENLDLNRLLEEMLHMLEVSISKKAVLHLNLTPNLPSVEVDATQVRQILMNLVINASEAIGDKSGVIAINTGCMDCDKNYLKDVWLDENITEGVYVFLEISDTGCGMNKDTLAKIFDPFFTTKFTGRGLGMAAVLGIVRGHKGAIKVYSEPGKGTTFKVLLPASSMPAEICNHDTPTDDWKGNGAVLLVDDEETIRDIGQEMLQELGFSTFTANDGRAAIEIFSQHPDITFVILDLTMPHMDGEQCFRELRKLNPDVKVIMSSGFNEFEVTRKFVGKGLAGFIQKPYKLSELKEAIRKI
jgi:PAS domain S-box-containing protein